MRAKLCVLALLLTAGMVQVPGSARGQEVPPASPVWPLPLYHDRDDRGEPLVLGSPFIYFHRQNGMQVPPGAEMTPDQEVLSGDPNWPVPLYPDRSQEWQLLTSGLRCIWGSTNRR
jgi:hypothetical protein